MQPEDWDDNEFIPDPEDKKPEVKFPDALILLYMMINYGFFLWLIMYAWTEHFFLICI